MCWPNSEDMDKAFSSLATAIESALSARGIPRGSRVWLAVSGGLDSMALLHAAALVDGDFGVVHVDHGLRAESAEDLAFVRAAAGQLGLAFRSHTVQGLADSAARKKWGVEAAARAARYAWIAEVAGPDGTVLTAHHADDQRETRLLHLLRGSRPEALTGMAAWNGEWGFQLGRPFLSLERASLLEAMNSAGRLWREDPTNASPDFMRNRIRHELIPLLDSIRPGWDAGLKRWGGIARGWRAHLEGMLADGGGAGEVLPLDLLDQAPSPLHLVGIWGHTFGFGQATVPALLELAAGHTEVGKKRCSCSHEVIRERTALVARPLGDVEDRAPRHWQPGPAGTEGLLRTPDGDLHWRMDAASGGVELDPADSTAQLEWNQVKPPLFLRTWRDGDRVAPLGMAGHQRVSDVLTQRKVPAADRPNQWVIEQADGRILWLVGHRIDRHAALSSESDAEIPRDILHLAWSPGQ